MVLSFFEIFKYLIIDNVFSKILRLEIFTNLAEPVLPDVEIKRHKSLFRDSLLYFFFFNNS